MRRLQFRSNGELDAQILKLHGASAALTKKGSQLAKAA